MCAARDSNPNPLISSQNDYRLSSIAEVPRDLRVYPNAPRNACHTASALFVDRGASRSAYSHSQKERSCKRCAFQTALWTEIVHRQLKLRRVTAVGKLPGAGSLESHSSRVLTTPHQSTCLATGPPEEAIRRLACSNPWRPWSPSITAERPPSTDDSRIELRFPGLGGSFRSLGRCPGCSRRAQRRSLARFQVDVVPHSGPSRRLDRSS
jgi:hypothetical protein